jgi:cation transport ATPase
LRGLGLRVTLLSGDHAGAAARVAATVGVDDWQAGLLPEAKRALSISTEHATARWRWSATA